MNRKALAAAQAVSAQAELRERGSALLAHLTEVRGQLAKGYRMPEIYEPLERAIKTACAMVGHDMEQEGALVRCRTCGEGTP